MHKDRAFLLASVGLWVGSGLLMALSSPARASEITPQQRSEIKTLMHVSGAESSFVRVGAQAASDFIDLFRKQRPDAPDTTFEAVKQEISAVMREAVPRLIELQVPVFAKFYTPQEIHDLIAFYRTPLGTKVAQVTPLAQAEAIRIAADWGMSLGLAERLDRRLRPQEELH